MSQQQQLDIKQLAQLLEELKNENKSKQLNAIQFIPKIAKAMGEDRTRTEFIPFIAQEMTDEEDDEILQELSKILVSLIDCLGGKQYSTLLFPAFEALCCANDNKIKDNVIAGLKEVINNIDPKKNEEMVVQLIKRLSNNINYQAKYVAAGIIPFVYPNVSANSQNEIIKIFINFSNDEAPQVRKYAAMNMKNLMALLPNSHENEILFVFSKLSRDEQDFIRILIVDALVPLSSPEQYNKQKNNILNFLKAFAEDGSWRVRFQMCQFIGEISKNFDKETVKKTFLQYYINFLQDEEPEMKSQALINLVNFCQGVPADEIQTKIVPILKSLSIDYHNFVRAALAKSVLCLSPIFGKKKAQELILPLFLTLIKENDSEIRINLFQTLQELIKVIGVQQVTAALLQAIKELIEDKKWRNRIIVLDHLPYLAKQIDEDQFNQNFLSFLFPLMKDTFNEVREKTADVLGDLAGIYGHKWAETQVIPKVLLLSSSKNYLHRKILALALNKISLNVNEEVNSKHILPQIQNLSKDPVPNVRFTIAKYLETSFKCFKEKEQLKKLLTMLGEDTDDDVKIQARQTLKVV